MKKRGKGKPHKGGRQRQGSHDAGGTHSRGGQSSGGLPAAARARVQSLTTANARRGAPAIAVARAYEPDERHALALLLLPFLIVALSLGLSQTLRPAARMIEAAVPIRPQPTAVVAPGRIVLAPLSLPSAAPAFLAPPAPISFPVAFSLPSEPPRIPVPAPAASLEALFVPTPALAMPLQAPAIAAIPVSPRPPLILPIPDFVLPGEAPAIAPPAAVAIVVPTPDIALPALPPAIEGPTLSVPSAMLACLPAPKRAALATPPAAAEFGSKLAQAAMAQTHDFVIYNAKYRRIAYPQGDVPSLYGACTDVVIRAYRSLGVDLQDLVQRGRVGSGDPNIDHRRTDTLRAFFARYGEKITPSMFGEDYKPGDIVTYYRPFSRISRAHIAVVSDVIGPSGHPMIVHNRGWGPQIEDALFVDRITGHYRFTGAPQLLAPHGRIADGGGAVSAGISSVSLTTRDGALPVRARSAGVIRPVR